MYKYLLFDLDGTLTEPFEGITNSVVYALNKFGIEVTDKRTLISFIGPPLVESFEVRYGFDNAKALKAVEYYREYFADKGIYENAVYDGIIPLLNSLKEHGKILILATSKPERFAKRILIHFGLESYFDYVAGATMDSSRVNKADVVRYALETCGISDLSEALMIGDREHDVLGAKSNSIKSLGVLYGYGSRSELQSAGADYIVDNPQEILKIVL